MAKPAIASALWATDATMTAGVEAGNPTKVDPGGAYSAQGSTVGFAFVGPYWNFKLNQYYQWCQYLDNLPNESAFLGGNFSWTGSHSFNDAVGVSKVLYYAPCEFEYLESGWGFSATDTYAIMSTLGAGMKLVPRMPSATITRMRAAFEIVANTFSFGPTITRRTSTFSGSGVATGGATTYTGGLAVGINIVDSGAISLACTSTAKHQIICGGASGGSTPSNCKFHWLELTVTDKTPLLY